MVQDYKQMYYELLKEYQKLQVKFKEAKKILETYTGEEVQIKQIETANAQSIEDLISLFSTLFQGRTDVYAKRYINKKTGKPGYAPQCENEWKQGICDKKNSKRKYNCYSCSHKKFKRLTPTVIEEHFRGKTPQCEDVIGIYPILPDETCHFLAIDFDKENWQKDVSAFRTTCNKKNIPVYIERSRSGNGAHAWIFFSEKTPIKLARKLGNLLLTETMKSHHYLKLKSYDRLFPNQDYMPKGGLGNLVALPLQGNAVRQDNSVFIDENFTRIPDQRHLLTTVEKVSLIQIQKICDDLHDESDLGKLLSLSAENKPWEQKKLTLTLSKSDFSSKVKITFTNRIYIHKKGMSSRSLNEIKRLAAFSNPEFYEKQKNRLSTHNVPRIIDCSIEHEDYLSVPRGCLKDLKSLLDGVNIEYEIDDKRNTGNPLTIDFNGKLRDEQKLAVRNLLAYDTGVLAATTAFGKTVVATNLIAERKVNTLILVHTSTLMKQWKGALENFLTFHEALPEIPKRRGRKKEVSHIGQLGSNKDTLRGRVDVAMMQSLVRGEEVRELVADYGMVIVDECHHVSAFGYEQILSKVNAKYVYGLSATPERRDGKHPIVFMQCGPIRYHVSASDQAKKRDFEHSFVTRFTTLKKPAHIKEEDFAIANAYATVVESEERNLRIVRDVAKAVEEGRHPIVLTRRTAQVEILEKLMNKHVSCEIITLTGSGTNKQKREALERLHAVQTNVQCVVIATGAYVGEGFDYPRLDTLFLAMPVSWSGVLHQYAGRLHRDYEGKREVIIYDYVDIHIRMLEKMYHKRVKGYAKLGYTAKTDYATTDEVGILFDQTDFLQPLLKDMNEARLNITISSPLLKKSCTLRMMSYLTGLELKKEFVTIITKQVSEYKATEAEMVKELLDQLAVAGFTVVQRANIHQKFIVIDEQVIWYGSINLLGYGRVPETMLRFVSKGVAGEIVGE